MKNDIKEEGYPLWLSFLIVTIISLLAYGAIGYGLYSLYKYITL